MDAVPRRLRKDPILEAVAEFRFRPSQAQTASAILPGYLFPQVRNEFPAHKSLPVSQLPPTLRSTSPELKYAPTSKLVGDRKEILIGDRSLGVLVEPTYPGWDKFKALVLSVWQLAEESGVIEQIERVSVKYTNLIEAPLGSDHFQLTNVDAALANKKLGIEPTQLQTEFRSGNSVVLVQLIFQGTATNSKDGVSRNGVVVIVDSIFEGPIDDYWQQMGKYLDTVHAAEKAMFFSLLATSTLSKYEPEY